jgi:hypothetical protein
MPSGATTFYKVTVHYCFVEDEERRRRLPSPPPHFPWAKDFANLIFQNFSTTALVQRLSWYSFHEE